MCIRDSSSTSALAGGATVVAPTATPPGGVTGVTGYVPIIVGSLEVAGPIYPGLTGIVGIVGIGASGGGTTGTSQPPISNTVASVLAPHINN